MSEYVSHPGKILGGFLLTADEPEHVNVTTFANTGEVLLTFNLRPGADLGQIMLGLSPHQVLQLIERLQAHADASARAVAAGRGGRKFHNPEPMP